MESVNTTSDTRIAVLGIIINNRNSVAEVNNLLHEYGEYIRGRLGIPNVMGNISAISIVLVASNSIISTLSGKLGMLKGVSAKAVYAKVEI